MQIPILQVLEGEEGEAAARWRERVMRMMVATDFGEPRRADHEKALRTFIECSDLLIAMGDVPSGCVGMNHEADDVEVRGVEIGGPVSYLWGLCVPEGLRGQGIGRHIVETAVDVTRRRGSRVLCLYALERVHGFWETLGFRHVRNDVFVRAL